MNKLNNIITRFMDSMWLGGPIFMKELIISSRKKRNYFVRFAYPAVMAFFVAMVWASVYSYTSSSGVHQVARMAQVGIHITTLVVWFQFIVVQILAIIMLSTAISDEIYHKTLGVLMTTPIGSFQIVFSKLLSKLLQLILLIAISLPLLAIIRVFGGVPLDYVLSSLCITLTAAIFAGSLSILFSIYSRQSQSVITGTVLVCFSLYAIPLIAYSILRSLNYNTISNFIPKAGLFFINPFMLMRSITITMRSPASVINFGLWLWHCAAILGLSVLVLVWAGFCVRKVGLRQITGQAGLFLTRKERKLAEKKQRLSYSTASGSGKIRDINWPPVIWREIANPLVKSGYVTFILSLALAMIMLIVAYGLCIYFDVLSNRETQIGFVLTYFFIGLVRTSTIASTSITSEKEARTWPILLISPLTEKEIVLGKIIGSCLRAWPYWLLLAVHVLVFTLIGVIKAATIIPLAFLVVSSALLVSSIGVMYSSICKRNSTSRTLNIMTFLAFTLPICCVPLYLGSPFFAIIMIFSSFGGYGEMFGFVNNSGSSQDVFGWLIFSQFSFIIFVIVYLLVAFALSAISISHIRWRIL